MAAGRGDPVDCGLFQLSSLKKRCLDKCRSPMMFVAMYWRGSYERRPSFAIGFHHGLVCIGCCWALMLLLFVVGSASIAWMLAHRRDDGSREDTVVGQTHPHSHGHRSAFMGRVDRRRGLMSKRSRRGSPA
jgi:hypothetical protein